jgi:hypothetical protein
MKTSAQRQHDLEARQANADQAERIVSVNERYDNGPGQQPIRNYHDLEAECNRQHKHAIERQAKLDEIKLICLRLNNPSVNLSVHRVVNTILRLIGE